MMAMINGETLLGGCVAICSFNVTVSGSPATISCPQSVVVGMASGECNGATVTYAAPTTENVCAGQTVTRTAGQASDTTFAKGTTSNTFELRDSESNVVGKWSNARAV